MLRFNFITQQRRWAEEQARSASEIPASPEDEAVDFMTTPPDGVQGNPYCALASATRRSNAEDYFAANYFQQNPSSSNRPYLRWRENSKNFLQI